MKFHRLAFPAAVLLPLALVACSSIQHSAPTQSAQAVLHATTVAQPSGEAIEGVIDFDQMGDGSVRVSGTVRNLAPGSRVGFHVHEQGVCEGDGTSAGGHFNPRGKAHGEPGKGHAGDLPMLQADATGTASVDYVSHELKLSGAKGIVGRGLVVHRDADDYETQPTGNSGPRVACGVIAARS